MTADSSNSLSFIQGEKKGCCQRSAFVGMLPQHGACIFFVVIERVKRFVNVH